MTPEQKFMNTAIDATIQLIEGRMNEYTKDTDKDYTYVYDFVFKLKEDLEKIKTK